MIYFSHLFEDEKAIKLIEDFGLGIETIETAVGYSLDAAKENGSLYYESMGFSNIDKELFINCHGPFLDLNPASYDRYIQNASKVRYEEAYNIATDLNARRIIYHSCFLPNIYFIEGWAQRMAEFYKAFLDNKEICISMENVLDEEFMPLLDVWEMVADQRFSICLDIGHANCYSSYSLREWIIGLDKSIGHLHLHDNFGKKDDHLPLGKGNINWDDIILLLSKKEKYNFTLEHNSYEDVLESLGFLERNYPKFFYKALECGRN